MLVSKIIKSFGPFLIQHSGNIKPINIYLTQVLPQIVTVDSHGATAQAGET